LYFKNNKELFYYNFTYFSLPLLPQKAQIKLDLDIWKKRGSLTITRSTHWGLRIAHHSWTSNAEAHADM